MRLLLVCVSVFLPLFPLRAQSDNQQKFSISGIVMNSVSGEPVRGAMVDLFGTERKSVLTGADGHFQIDGVYAGYANISARRPGFDQQNVRQQHIKIDGNTDTIVVKLMPLSKISGRILDREGEPIEGVFVQCMGQQTINGRKQWVMHGGTSSDETGSFTIEDLNPGTYILGTQEKQLYYAKAKSEAARYIYPSTFYPDANTRDLAQHVDLAAGAEMKIDMTLHSVRGTRVSLTTVPPSPNVFASIGQEDERFGGNQARADKSGVLTFPAVPPGSWKITVQSMFAGSHNGPPGGNDQMFGELPIEVGSTDIENLKVPLGKPTDIPVIVSGAQNVAQVYLQLFSKAGMVNGSNPEQNGELKIHSLQPGTYRVVAQANGQNTCVTSMMSGSQELLREELVVSAGASIAPIQVVVSNNCAQVTINTNTQDNSWLLISSDRKGFEPRMMQGVASGYTAGGLTDGDYKIYAFDDASNLEYANPDALREFKGQTVHLEAGQKATVQLEVNERHAQ